MKIKQIDRKFSVCRVRDYPRINLLDEFCFTGKTDEECSLVCPTELVPADALEREDGWRAFRIQGVLDFSLIGVLSRIATLLADHHIGIFAISTYNTDYILTREEDFERALELLASSGYEMEKTENRRGDRYEKKEQPVSDEAVGLSEGEDEGGDQSLLSGRPGGRDRDD